MSEWEWKPYGYEDEEFNERLIVDGCLAGGAVKLEDGSFYVFVDCLPEGYLSRDIIEGVTVEEAKQYVENWARMEGWT